MNLRSRALTSSRSSHLDVPPERAWAVVASGEDGPRWYLDAVPFVVRGALDRAVGGQGRAWPAPGRARLRPGDRGGFWVVTEVAEEPAGPGRPARHELVLEADVRAPGRVLLSTTVHGEGAGTRLTQQVTLLPQGPAGWAYLAVDLPAREVVVELTHRRTCRDVRAA